jgi:hypothetical protein
MHFREPFQPNASIQKMAFLNWGFAVKYEDGHNTVHLKPCDHGVHVFKQRLVRNELIHIYACVNDQYLAGQVSKCNRFDCIWTFRPNKFVQVFDAHRDGIMCVRVCVVMRCF